MSDRNDMRELDECLARVPMPAGLEARIVAATTLRSVGPSPARRSLAIGLAFAAGVVLTVLALRGWPLAQDDHGPSEIVEAPERSVPEPSQNQLARAAPAPGLTLSSDACEWSQIDELLRFEAGCRLHLAQPAMDLEIWSPTRLQPIADGVALREGEVMFVVERVEDRERPARVEVSGGSIEVIGTRFAVSQASAAGHVDLLEGKIQFRRLDGELEAIEPGQRYGWSATTSEATSDASTEPGTRPRPPVNPETDRDAKKLELEQGLAEVARLRRAGDLEAAIAKLDALARTQSEARTLEVISYERGTLVERSAASSSACAAWYRHRRRFPAGRYDAEVERRIEQLQCAPE